MKANYIIIYRYSINDVSLPFCITEDVLELVENHTIYPWRVHKVDIGMKQHKKEV